MKIKHLIFDLDNTLYPCTEKMASGIAARMMQCVADFFHTTVDQAAKIRSEHIANFSTTLEWLQSEGLTDTEKYFAAVHPQNEADELQKDPNLRQLISLIALPKIVFTNSPKEHAERVLEKLGVRDLFDDICDIRDCGLKGKPYPSAFETALHRCCGSIDDTVFFDDMRKYTDGFEALGGTAVLVGNENGRPLNKNADAVTKEKPVKAGCTLRINTIFEIPALLQILNDL
ncbi:MAG: HAD-IA family hydrolase [Treponema sp.]